MELKTAIDFLRLAIPQEKGVWADIGAGSGIFTLALDTLLPKGSTIYAADKNPHLLYKLQLENSALVIEELDFNRPVSNQLPLLDGIVMANTLHYAEHPRPALENILKLLKPGGLFVLIEYELSTPLRPWIPYPIPFKEFEKLAAVLQLARPTELARIPSSYGHQHIYLAHTVKR